MVNLSITAVPFACIFAGTELKIQIPYDNLLRANYTSSAKDGSRSEGEVKESKTITAITF